MLLTSVIIMGTLIALTAFSTKMSVFMDDASVRGESLW